MDEALIWTWGTVFGLTVLGAAAGIGLLLVPPAFLAAAVGANLFLAAVIFVDVFVAAGFATQLYRRGLDHSTLVGGTSAALAMFAFFATPLAVDVASGIPIDPNAALMFLVAVPLFAGGLAAAGTVLLMDGVDRYRRRYGRRHAPR